MNSIEKGPSSSGTPGTTTCNGTFGEPKDRAVLTTRWTFGPVEATWAMNVIGKNGSDAGVGEVKQYLTHDLQLAYNTPLKGAKVIVGAINAGGKLPELITDGAKPFNYNLYDAYGAQAYFRVQMKF